MSAVRQGGREKPNQSRRRFLTQLGALGGSAAVYTAASALGLMPALGSSPSFSLTSIEGEETQRTAIIIGAGIGGLVAAYELKKAGYRVTILEASARIGGRNLTARRGTVIDELGAPQTCAFDDHPDMYFNCGPARIPGTHHRLLDYCRTFGIALENFVNQNPNAYIRAAGLNGGVAMRQREYLADAKGFLSEIAAKSVSDQALDQSLNQDDMERLEAFVARFGDLDKDMRYKGTDRAGYAAGGLLTPGQKKQPVDKMTDLLATRYWRFPMFFAEGETQFPAMMQPVGGMDKIVDAFVAQVGHLVETSARVTDFRVTDDGVTVDYVQNGRPLRLKADYCFNSMPGHLVNGINHNLPADFSSILMKMSGVKLSKVGLQMKSRFWEEEEIYGGISWTDETLLQIWYPSHGTLGRKGVLLGGYVFGPGPNDEVASMASDKRIEAALAMGEAMHPGRYRSNFETGISIAWQNYNHMLGCGSGFGRGEDPAREKEIAAYRLALQAPVKGRYFMIGDQVSFHPGWQEGAIATTHLALSEMDKGRSSLYA